MPNHASGVIVYPKRIPIERHFALQHAIQREAPLSDDERAALLRWREERAMNRRDRIAPRNERLQETATGTSTGAATVSSPPHGRSLVPVPRTQPVSMTRVNDFHHREEITQAMAAAHRQRVLSSMSFFDAKHRKELEALQREAEETRRSMTLLRQHRAAEEAYSVNGQSSETVVWGQTPAKTQLPSLLTAAAPSGDAKRIPEFAVRYPLEEAVKRRFCKADHESAAVEELERAKARAERAEREAAELVAREAAMRDGGAAGRVDAIALYGDNRRVRASNATDLRMTVSDVAVASASESVSRGVRKAEVKPTAPVLTPAELRRVDQLCRLRGLHGKTTSVHLKERCDPNRVLLDSAGAGNSRAALRKVPEFNYWDSVDAVMRLRDVRRTNKC